MNHEEKNVVIDEHIAFHCGTRRILNLPDFYAAHDETTESIYEKNADFIAAGSDWIQNGIQQIELNIAKYKHLEGSHYKPTPKTFKRKGWYLNVQNHDEKCFLHSVLAHLHHIPSKNHPNRVSKYKVYDYELNVVGISWPMKEDEVRVFEEKNNFKI